MSIILLSELDSSHKQQIQSIIEDAMDYEPVTISFPMSDAALYALYESDGTICSAAAFTPEDDCTYECCAYTKPALRGQGMFSQLMDAAIDVLPEDSQFLFYTDGKSSDANAVIDAYEAECVLQEHMMELSAEQIRELSEQSLFSDSSILHVEEHDKEQTRTLSYKNHAGSVQISVFSSYYYLYGLEIQEKLRGKGHGKHLLLHVLTDLCQRNPMAVRLQVSGNNLPAFHLYKKTGFRIIETLSCYLY